MQFIADFHIHSKYSRATAADLDLAHLFIAACVKGLTVLGTGDFTHPQWWCEIRENLVPAEEGLFKLRDDLAASCRAHIPKRCGGGMRFMLVTEISNIYKKGDKTRKNHNLVFMPDLEAAERFNRRLDQIGNIRSDGRPILGLDARDLLEIVLETAPGAFLVPAHIWTPWFSVLGSKSGFDSIEECFADLSGHVFALETGLSSDPPMNWRVSALDRFTLMSNSDAHSPAKLAREANCFDTDLDYASIRRALEKPCGGGFLGTLEFFPEEGKYHLDGHRKCNFRSLPAQSRDLRECCPQCGKPLTLGVLYRVDELADRAQGVRPPGAAPFQSLIPLEDLLAEVYQVGAKSRKVAQAYEQLIARYGPELHILRDLPLEEITTGPPLLVEAIRRMRSSQVRFAAGYDGEYGRLSLFDAGERQALAGQRNLFGDAAKASVCSSAPCAPASPQPKAPPQSFADPVPEPQPSSKGSAGIQLNPEQQSVIDHGRGPLMILAGPGTGKTRTITCRMAALIQSAAAQADHILAVTFTNQAADEMRHRLKQLLPGEAALPLVTTFHGFCWQILQEAEEGRPMSIADETIRREVLADAVRQAAADGPPAAVEACLAAIVEAKQRLLGPDDDLTALSVQPAPQGLPAVYAAYQELLDLQNLYDFEDLIFKSIELLSSDPDVRRELRRRYSHVFVDEFQDINDGQYRLIRLLSPEQGNLCVIGDPDQAIYGFRGSDVRFFKQFVTDYPTARRIHLARNYRSTETILQVSHQVIRGHRLQLGETENRRVFSGIDGHQTVTIMQTPSARAEAVAIGRAIEQMVGGTGFHAVDFGKLGEDRDGEGCAFSDFGVLFRTREQGRLILEVLSAAGIPCQFADQDAWRKRPLIAKLLSLLKILDDQAVYADLFHLNELISPAVSKETLAVFKSWAFGRKLPLETALHTILRLPIPGLSTARQHRLAAWVRLINTFKAETSGFDVVSTLRHLCERLTFTEPERDDDLRPLFEKAEGFTGPRKGFTAARMLDKDIDLYRQKAQKVTLLTLHAAKGLEFPVVFIAGCEDGLIPYHRPNHHVDLDEERRLFYVAITRARQRLFMTWARRRSLYGRTVEAVFSPFAETIEQYLMNSPATSAKEKTFKQQQMSLF